MFRVVTDSPRGHVPHRTDHVRSLAIRVVAPGAFFFLFLPSSATYSLQLISDVQYESNEPDPVALEILTSNLPQILPQVQQEYLPWTNTVRNQSSTSLLPLPLLTEGMS